MISQGRGTTRETTRISYTKGEHAGVSMTEADIYTRGGMGERHQRRKPPNLAAKTTVFSFIYNFRHQRINLV